MTTAPRSVDRRPARWGVRTLAFLMLALLALGVSGLQGHYTVLSLAALLIGLVGSLICTTKGISALLK